MGLGTRRGLSNDIAIFRRVPKLSKIVWIGGSELFAPAQDDKGLLFGWRSYFSKTMPIVFKSLPAYLLIKK